MVLHLARLSQLPLLCSLLSSCHFQPNLQTRSCQSFPPNLSPVSLPLLLSILPSQPHASGTASQHKLNSVCNKQLSPFFALFWFCFTTLEQTTQLILPIKTKMICFYPSSSLKPQSHPEGPGFQCTGAAKPHEAHGAHTDISLHLQEILTVFKTSRGHQITDTDLCFTAH